MLFGSVATVSHSFTLSFSSLESSSLSRQVVPEDPACSPSLWDTTAPNVYGIQMYPSNLQLLPSSLRSSPFTITTKTLSPCENIGMSKDFLLPFVFNWTFLDPIPGRLVDVDPNDWVAGGEGGGAVLIIPSLFLEDREAFPMNQSVGIQVNFFLSAEFQFFFSNQQFHESHTYHPSPILITQHTRSLQPMNSKTHLFLSLLKPFSNSSLPPSPSSRPLLI